MEDIKIEMLPAISGDSFIVTVHANRRINIIIDSGYGETYKEYLKGRITEIRNSGDSISLMVITHIDSDHISGAIKFLEENNSRINSEEFIEIDEIWHNSLRHVYIDDRLDDIIEDNDKIILDYLQMKGMPIPSDSKERRNKKISAIQGSVLGALIRNGFYNWNGKAKGKAICVNNVEQPCYFNELKVFLLSPSLERVDKLREEWEEKLRNNKKFKGKITNNTIFDDVFEMMLGESFDKSIRKRHKLISGYIDLIDYLDEEEEVDEDSINCSSISFILEYKEKRLLFLGDSNPNDIFNKIKELYNWDEKNRIFFDAIKISHHGSRGNTTSKLLTMIDSDKFIISTNGSGRYNHPHYETIAKIVCRDTEYTRELIFNYESIAEKFNNTEWMNKYKYKIKKVSDGKIQEVYINGVGE